MLFIFSILLPLLLISFLGYALTRWNVLGGTWFEGVNLLTSKVLVPSLLFLGMFKTGLPSQISWQVLCSFYLPMLLLFLAVHIFYKNSHSPAMALSSVYCNSIFMGIPLLMQSLGEGSLQYAFPVIAFHSLFSFGLYYWAHAAYGDEPQQRLQVLITSIKNPIVASLLLGLAFHSLHIPLPEGVSIMLDMLAKAALPCALIVLGASLANFRLQQSTIMLVVLCLKLLMLPLLVFACAHFVFAIPKDVTAVLVLIAACPVGVNAYSVVQEKGGDTSLVSSAILASSLLSILSLPFFIWLVKL
jgi:predicted permease